MGPCCLDLPGCAVCVVPWSWLPGQHALLLEFMEHMGNPALRIVPFHTLVLGT